MAAVTQNILIYVTGSKSLSQMSWEQKLFLEQEKMSVGQKPFRSNVFRIKVPQLNKGIQIKLEQIL